MEEGSKSDVQVPSSIEGLSGEKVYVVYVSGPRVALPDLSQEQKQPFRAKLKRKLVTCPQSMIPVPAEAPETGEARAEPEGRAEVLMKEPFEDFRCDDGP